MAKYICDTVTGALFSYCPNDTDPVAGDEILAAKGLEVVTGAALDDTHQWDAATKSVQIVAAPVVTRFIPTWRYIQAFTPAESAAIRASADQQVQHILYMLGFAQNVDMNSGVIQGGLSYLVAVGLLTQDRATAILATEAV